MAGSHTGPIRHPANVEMALAGNRADRDIRVHTGLRVRAWLAATAAALAVMLPAQGARAGDDNEVKADMLCNMAKFVQWPDAVVSQNKGQLVVTILGEDDLAGSIANVLSQRNVNGKPVYVRFARRIQDVRGSQIVYIAASEMPHAEEILAALKGTPVLTVSDTEGFAGKGGMVDFSGIAPRVRFEVSLVRAEQAGLRISSKLLAIARVVDGAP